MKKLIFFIVLLAFFAGTSTSFSGIWGEHKNNTDRSDHRMTDDSWTATSSGQWDYWDTSYFNVKREKKRKSNKDYDESDHDQGRGHGHGHGHGHDRDAGSPPVAPEPASFLLFLTGSAVFAYRRYFKKG